MQATENYILSRITTFIQYAAQVAFKLLITFIKCKHFRIHLFDKYTHSQDTTTTTRYPNFPIPCDGIAQSRSVYTTPVYSVLYPLTTNLSVHIQQGNEKLRLSRRIYTDLILRGQITEITLTGYDSIEN